MNCSDLEPDLDVELRESHHTKNNVVFFCGKILTPCLCMFGIMGNIINTAVMTRYHFKKRIDCLEKTAYMGLTALAVSDMLYCIVVLPRGFFNKDYHMSRGFELYYHVYSETVINMFIMSSTGLTVVMAVARYFAVCRPLHARQILSLHCTKVALIIVFIVSIVFNLPRLWVLEYISEKCLDTGETMYLVIPGLIKSNDTNIHLRNIGHSYRFLWAVFGNFIPLALLVFCNIGLLRSLSRSRHERRSLNARGGNPRLEHQRLTLTLVVIIIMFCLLVAPYEISHFVMEMTNKNGWSIQMYYMRGILTAILNLLQTINFSTNFILYCTVNTVFRNVIRKWMYNCSPTHNCCVSQYKFYSHENSTTCVTMPMTEVTGEA